MKPERYTRPILEIIAPEGVWDWRAWCRLGIAAAIVVIPLLSLRNSVLSGRPRSIVNSFGLMIVLYSAVVLIVGRRVVASLSAFVAPEGSTTPYQRDYSYEKSLVMSGQSQEALQLYEERLRTHPDDAALAVEAAELHVLSGSPARAVALFQLVRMLEGCTHSQRMYATNRLIDIYLGDSSAADESAGIAELSWIARTFPGTPQGEGARGALRRLQR